MDIIQEAKEALTKKLTADELTVVMLADLISRLVDRLECKSIESAPKDGTEILGCNVDGEIEIIWMHGKEWQARDLSRFDAIKWLPLPPVGESR